VPQVAQLVHHDVFLRGGGVEHQPPAVADAPVSAAGAAAALRKLRAAKARTAAFDALSDAEIAALKARAAEVLIPLTARYATEMGLSPRRVRITSAKSRFGSCGRDGGICYSWRLMLYPAGRAR